MEFSQELIDVFKKSSFYEEKARLLNLNTNKPINIEPDEDGYIYMPDAMLSPTLLIGNGYEDAEFDYVFIMKLINEFRDQMLKGEKTT